jgi:hypothetical protein
MAQPLGRVRSGVTGPIERRCSGGPSCGYRRRQVHARLRRDAHGEIRHRHLISSFTHAQSGQRCTLSELVWSAGKHQSCRP